LLPAPGWPFLCMRQFLHPSIPFFSIYMQWGKLAQDRCMNSCFAWHMAHIVRQESAILVCMHARTAACQRVWSGKEDVQRQIWRRQQRRWEYDRRSNYGYGRTAAITCRQKSDTRLRKQQTCLKIGRRRHHTKTCPKRSEYSGRGNSVPRANDDDGRRTWQQFCTRTKQHTCMRQASSPRIHLLHGACLRTWDRNMAAADLFPLLPRYIYRLETVEDL
jgi:hypothetical protein